VEFPGAVYHVTARGNERKVDVARDLGYRDGGSVRQIRDPSRMKRGMVRSWSGFSLRFRILQNLVHC